MTTQPTLPNAYQGETSELHQMLDFTPELQLITRQLIEAERARLGIKDEDGTKDDQIEP